MTFKAIDLFGQAMLSVRTPAVLAFSAPWARLARAATHKEISAMKWNTPDWLFGWLAGTLFGLYIDMAIGQTFEPSPDARSYIGLVGMFGFLAVIILRQRWLRRTLLRKHRVSPLPDVRNAPTRAQHVRLTGASRRHDGPECGAPGRHPAPTNGPHSVAAFCEPHAWQRRPRVQTVDSQ